MFDFTLKTAGATIALLSAIPLASAAVRTAGQDGASTIAEGDRDNGPPRCFAASSRSDHAFIVTAPNGTYFLQTYKDRSHIPVAPVVSVAVPTDNSLLMSFTSLGLGGAESNIGVNVDIRPNVLSKAGGRATRDGLENPSGHGRQFRISFHNGTAPLWADSLAGSAAALAGVRKCIVRRVQQLPHSFGVSASLEFASSQPFRTAWSPLTRTEQTESGRSDMSAPAPVTAALKQARSPNQASSYTFGDFPVRSVHRGPLRMPDFNGRDRNFRMFRTRITDAIKTGPNFAGHYAIVQMGCGTDCLSALLADVATGKVYNFPLGGDAYMSLDLKYRLQSSLIIARWVQKRRCFQE